MLRSAKWLLGGWLWSWLRLRSVLRFDPRAQGSDAINDRLKGYRYLGDGGDRFPKFVGINRLIERARSDLLRGRIVGQEFNPHVAGGEGRRVDDEVVHPLFRVSFLRDGGDDDW